MAPDGQHDSCLERIPGLGVSVSVGGGVPPCMMSGPGSRLAPPARKGFGTRFIQGAVVTELGGRIDLAFDPEGVRCRFEAPL